MDTLVKRAIKDRFLIVDKKRDQVIYLPDGTNRKFSNPEEKVQVQTFVDLIYKYDYPAEKIRVCPNVKIGSSTREADVVVYRDKECKDPFIIVECKKRNVSNSTFEGAVDQGFSYAAVTNAEYVWATSGDRNAHFEVWHDAINEREANRIDRVPKHKEEKKFAYGIRRRLRGFFRNPIMSDTLIYSLVLIISTLVLSKVAVEYFDDIYKFTKPLWIDYGMDFNWIYNSIIVVSTLLSFAFGGIFMRSHKLFRYSPNKKRLTYFFIALVLFLPSWYMGVDNQDPLWWSWAKYEVREYQMVTYLWPYVKSLPFQIIAIYGLIWLMRLSQRQEDKRKRKRQ